MNNKENSFPYSFGIKYELKNVNKKQIIYIFDKKIS